MTFVFYAQGNLSREDIGVNPYKVSKRGIWESDCEVGDRFLANGSFEQWR